MKTGLIFAATLLVTQAANADGIYYCTKNGKKIMTDQPCQNLGANQSKYTAYENLQPLNTMAPPSHNAIQRAKEFDQEQTRRQPDQGNQQRQASVQAEQNKAQCRELEQQKQAIVAQQRMPQQGSMHDYLRRQREGVDAEIYRRQCETL